MADDQRGFDAHPSSSWLQPHHQHQNKQLLPSSASRGAKAITSLGRSSAPSSFAAAAVSYAGALVCASGHHHLLVHHLLYHLQHLLQNLPVALQKTRCTLWLMHLSPVASCRYGHSGKTTLRRATDWSEPSALVTQATHKYFLHAALRYQSSTRKISALTNSSGSCLDASTVGCCRQTRRYWATLAFRGRWLQSCYGSSV